MRAKRGENSECGGWGYRDLGLLIVIGGMVSVNKYFFRWAIIEVVFVKLRATKGDPADLSD